MRKLVLFGLFWGIGAGLAAAQDVRPAEVPPSDFPGAQYIDSTGCVFVRSGREWAAKLDDDGAQTCGFPPSRSAWSTDSVTPPPPSMAEIERDLTVSLVEAEGAGIDLMQLPTNPPQPVDVPTVRGAELGGARDAAIPVEAEPEAGPGAEIARALRADPVLEARMTMAVDPNARLCTLLGLKPSLKGGLPLGLDPTRGYCMGLAPPALPGWQAVAPHATGKDAPSGSATVIAKVEKSADPAARPITTHVAKQGNKARPVVVGPEGKTAVASKLERRATNDLAASPRKETTATSSGPDLGNIPATARFVQIGQFNPDGVTAAVAAIRTMGYPVARQTQLGSDGKRIIMAGPFDTRERLVAALDRLRRAGYPRAFAR